MTIAFSLLNFRDQASIMPSSNRQQRKEDRQGSGVPILDLRTGTMVQKRAVMGEVDWSVMSID